MSKFTHFPWFAVQPDHAHGWWVVSHDEYGDMCVDESGDGGFREGTARLIAATPDLLGALEETRKDLVVLRGNITDAAKSCSRWDGVPELIDAWIRRNDAAIAKARGES